MLGGAFCGRNVRLQRNALPRSAGRMSTDESRVVKSGGLNDENQGSNIMTSRAVKSMVEGLPRSRQNHLVEGRLSKIKSCTA